MCLLQFCRGCGLRGEPFLRTGTVRSLGFFGRELNWPSCESPSPSFYDTQCLGLPTLRDARLTPAVRTVLQNEQKEAKPQGQRNVRTVYMKDVLDQASNGKAEYASHHTESKGNDLLPDNCPHATKIARRFGRCPLGGLIGFEGAYTTGPRQIRLMTPQTVDVS
jgi:hypothetical protein